jgi:hypothetical protein
MTMAEFRFERMQDLLRQLLVSPPEVREGNADRLEGLLLQFDAERVYPYEFLYFRITGFRLNEDILDTFPGAEVLADLMRILKELSDTVPRNILDVDEEVLTLADVADRCSVSVRTVRRWREKGLVARSYYFPDGRLKAGVRASALDRFVQVNRESVESSRRFSRLSNEEEARALDIAKALAVSEEVTLTSAAARIAADLGRAVETVRQVLLRHDEEHPDEAVFGPPSGPIGAADRRRIAEEHRRGRPIEQLCAEFGRSRASIYRILNQERAAELQTEELDYFEEPAFEEPEAEQAILGAPLDALLRRLQDAAASDQPGDEGTPFEWRRSPLTREEETALFRAYNFARWQADRIRGSLNPKRYVATGDLNRIEELLGTARTIREVLLAIHTPLAVHIAAEQSKAGGDPERLAAAGMSRLGVLVDSFDYGGRARFPSYANLELLKWFALHADTASANR